MSMRVCGYASMRVFRYAGIPVCKYAGMRVCEYAGMRLVAANRMEETIVATIRQQQEMCWW